MSFLKNMKKKGVREDKTEPQRSYKEDDAPQVLQLPVDVFKTSKHIIIYAQTCGADMGDIEVSIEGDSKIVLIEGKTARPEKEVFEDKIEAGTFLAKECAWSSFYRRIILPHRVDIDQAEAKICNGVLILLLPIIPTSVSKIEESSISS